MASKENNWLSFFKNKTILFVIFTTGACLLILEIVATRMLSPFFGNTIYTVTSVIGVVLAALSFGYYFGGSYADKYPQKNKFYSIIYYSGISVLILYIVYVCLVPVLAYDLPITSGPLILSIILFLVPSFLLGMLSPFAIKLHRIKNKKVGIGKVSGEVFFASTLGSIFGTFLAGFYLIPNFGIKNIVLGTGLLLLIIGFFGNIKIFSKHFLFVHMCLWITLLGLGSLLEIKLKGQIYAKDGVYEQIRVITTNYNDRPAKILLQDASFSSAKYLGTNEPAFAYSKYYKLYELVKPGAKNALFIGGGAYTMPRLLSEDNKNIQIDVCEIEEELIQVAKEHFDYAERDSIANHITDGRRFLHDTHNVYDIIFADVYASLYSLPAHFTTKEFFALSKDKLANDGIFLANIIADSDPNKNSFFFSIAKTFKEVFPNSYFIATNSRHTKDVQNFVFVGLKTDLNLLSRAQNEELDIFKTLSDKVVDISQYDLSQYPVLTDNYAPVESMTASLVKQSKK